MQKNMLIVLIKYVFVEKVIELSSLEERRASNELD